MLLFTFLAALKIVQMLQPVPPSFEESNAYLQSVKKDLDLAIAKIPKNQAAALLINRFELSVVELQWNMLLIDESKGQENRLKELRAKQPALEASLKKLRSELLELCKDANNLPIIKSEIEQFVEIQRIALEGLKGFENVEAELEVVNFGLRTNVDLKSAIDSIK